MAAAQQSFGSGKLWVATVMPGYNDLRIRPGVGFATDRAGGSYYQQAWNAAIASKPNWVVITSFNEWPEGTYIEPSAAYGDQYIRLTAAGSSQFKSGGGVQIAAAAVQMAPPVDTPTPAPTPTPLPTPTVPTAFVTSAAGLNLRSGPGIDYEVLTVLLNGTSLPITGHDPAFADWWQVDDGGQVGWVSGELVQAAGPLESVAAVTFAPPVILLPTPTATTFESIAVSQILTIPTPVASGEWLVNPYLQWNQ